MTKKVRSILFSLCLLAISLTLMLVFFVFKNNNKEALNEPINITTSNVDTNVSNNSYTYTLTSVENCYIEKNTIYKTSEICQFKIILYDNLGQITEELTPQIISNFSGCIEFQFGNILINSLEEFELTVIYDTIDLSIKLYIKNSV